MDDPCNHEWQLDPRVWRSIVTSLLASTGGGLVVCDASLTILFATPRALHLLSRLGMGPERLLPEEVATLVNAQLSVNEVSHARRVPAVRGGSAVEIQTTILRGMAPVCSAIWLREEVLRDDELHAVLKKRFSISPRGFQLAQLIRKGLTNRQISERLSLTESTVKVYLHQLYRDCGITSRTALIALLDRLPR